MTTAHQNIPTIRDQLSAKIVSYCDDRCLRLDGIALQLESGEPLDADMCDAIGAYCAEASLDLGGLLAEVDALAAAYAAQDASEYLKLHADPVFSFVDILTGSRERQMRDLMSNRDKYDLEEVRRVVAHWADIAQGGVEHRVSRSILEERLAELGQLVDLGPKNTHELQPGDILCHFGATLRLVERREHHNPEQPANPTITFATQCLHLEPNAAMPRHWVEREGGYTIQGNRLAIWWVLGIDPNPVLHDAHVSAYYED